MGGSADTLWVLGFAYGSKKARGWRGKRARDHEIVEAQKFASTACGKIRFDREAVLIYDLAGIFFMCNYTLQCNTAQDTPGHYRILMQCKVPILY